MHFDNFIIKVDERTGTAKRSLKHSWDSVTKIILTTYFRIDEVSLRSDAKLTVFIFKC